MRHQEEPIAAVIERARKNLNARRYFCAARFEGRCSLCRHPILVGELVTLTSGSPAVHASCHKDAITSQEARG